MRVLNTACLQIPILPLFLAPDSSIKCYDIAMNKRWVEICMMRSVKR